MYCRCGIADSPRCPRSRRIGAVWVNLGNRSHPTNDLRYTDLTLFMLTPGRATFQSLGGRHSNSVIPRPAAKPSVLRPSFT